jgi:hypothetical protein
MKKRKTLLKKDLIHDLNEIENKKPKFSYKGNITTDTMDASFNFADVWIRDVINFAQFTYGVSLTRVVLNVIYDGDYSRIRGKLESEVTIDIYEEDGKWIGVVNDMGRSR